MANFLAVTDRGGHFYAVHAAPGVSSALRPLLFPDAALAEDESDVEAEILQHANKSIIERWGAVIGSPEALRLGCGDLVPTLENVCNTLGPDLLVMGRGERADLGALGMVSRAMLDRAAWPIMIARQTPPDVEINTIHVAIDLTRDSVALLELGLQLAVRHGATVTPVAVATTGSGGDHARLWGESTNPPGKIRKMMQQYVTRVTGALDVGFAAERELSDVLLEAELVNGDPGEIICEMSEAADLVIIGKNRSAGGRGLGRVAEHVARFADAHVIVVPTEARIDTPS